MISSTVKEKLFVKKDSVVRQIWGSSDTVLFIFAGAAAEFALNKAVDWLYFTGRLPADPLTRLFSTVTYAGRIIFSNEEDALAAIDQVAAIHKGVENARGNAIPDWAYRDVLFLLIDYSIRSFELLQRQLTREESADVFDVFNRVGLRMGLKDLPGSLTEWEQARNNHLNSNLVCSTYTIDLYQQYKKHLGAARYGIIIQVQTRICPQRVVCLLKLNAKWWFGPMLSAYKLSRVLRLNTMLKSLLLPATWKKQVKALDRG